MKKTYIMLLAGMTLAAGSALYAYRTSDSMPIGDSYRLMAQSADNKTPQPRKVQARANQEEPQGELYLASARSVYDAEGRFDPENGVVTNFATHILIEDKDVTIWGLMDYTTGELDYEYPVKGTYDSRRDIISIPDASTLSVKLAEVYDPSQYTNLTLYLYAGDVDAGSGQIFAKSTLDFSLREDGSWESQCGYGAYDLYYDSFYEIYNSVTFRKPAAGADIFVTTPEVDLSSTFVCAGLPVQGNITIMNQGADTGSFTLTSSTDEIALDVTSGNINGCENLIIPFVLTPSKAGEFEGIITLTAEGQGQKTVRIKALVNEKPDYTRITKAGSAPFGFEMDDTFPFIISTWDDKTVAKSSNDGNAYTYSSFTCVIDVPEGKTGVFSWNAAMCAQRPNSMRITVDGETFMYEGTLTNTDPYDMSGAIALPAGKHDVQFILGLNADWYNYGLITEGYVWDLNLELVDAAPNNAAILDNNVEFSKTYYDSMPVAMTSSVKVMNIGTEPLKVLEVNGNGNFSGTAPEISVPQGGEIEVPLRWMASAVGEDRSDITIATTGGDLTVHCSGTAEKLPYDYSTIVKEGNFSFNTGMDWPFVMNEGNSYAYNSTSKSDINGITMCWLKVSFEVPAGEVGNLSWVADNDSEDLFWFMETPSLISGTQITIDGGNEVILGGVGADASSSALYSADKLEFAEGRHDVLFQYKKTDNKDRYVFGDDMLKIYQLSLKTESIGDNKGELSGNTAMFSNPVMVGVTGHYPLVLRNRTTETPEILSTECDGPFSAREVRVDDGNLIFNVEFTPAAVGSFSGTLTIHTNIGDYTVDCSGNAIESDLGTIIYYEGFEYDFTNDWVIADNNADGNTWERVSGNLDAFSQNNLTVYEGAESLFLQTHNPSTGIPHEADDTAATAPIAIPEKGNTVLRVMAKAFAYIPQTLTILAGEGDDLSTYETIGEISFDGKVDWAAYNIDLKALAGKTVRIAFLSKDNEGSYIAIDDIMVGNSPADGVSLIPADEMSTEWYAPDGTRLARPVKGINIRVIRKADGSVSSSKVVF